MKNRWTIAGLKNSRESEDKVEFKKAEHGNVSYNGGDKTKTSEKEDVFLVMSSLFVTKAEVHLCLVWRTNILIK